jgi:hypothetical protein
MFYVGFEKIYYFSLAAIILNYRYLLQRKKALCFNLVSIAARILSQRCCFLLAPPPAVSRLRVLFSLPDGVREDYTFVSVQRKNSEGRRKNAQNNYKRVSLSNA